MTGLISPPAPIFPLELSAEERIAQNKVARQAAVDAIKVTTSSGKIFDGNELSQNRLARNIVAMAESGEAETPWKLADNTWASIPIDEMIEALNLARAEQTQIWQS